MDVSEAKAALKQRWQDFYERVLRPEVCVFCGATSVLWNGSRCRSASVVLVGVVVFVAQVPCRRVKCKRCRRSWTLRPPELWARRHYQADVVSQATSGYLFDGEATQDTTARWCSCARRTVARWLRWLGGMASAAQLSTLLVRVSEYPIRLPEHRVAALGRKAVSQARQQVLSQAAEVLAHVEALGVALGLEPPALHHVAAWAADPSTWGPTAAQCPIPALAQRPHGPPEVPL